MSNTTNRRNQHTLGAPCLASETWVSTTAQIPPEDHKSGCPIHAASSHDWASCEARPLSLNPTTNPGDPCLDSETWVSTVLRVALLALLAGFSTPAQAAPKTYLANDYGAKGDGTTLDTAAIQKAIDTAAQIRRHRQPSSPAPISPAPSSSNPASRSRYPKA